MTIANAATVSRQLSEAGFTRNDPNKRQPTTLVTGFSVQSVRTLVGKRDPRLIVNYTMPWAFVGNKQEARETKLNAMADVLETLGYDVVRDLPKGWLFVTKGA